MNLSGKLRCGSSILVNIVVLFIIERMSGNVLLILVWIVLVIFEIDVLMVLVEMIFLEWLKMWRVFLWFMCFGG